MLGFFRCQHGFRFSGYLAHEFLTGRSVLQSGRVNSLGNFAPLSQTGSEICQMPWGITRKPKMGEEQTPRFQLTNDVQRILPKIYVDVGRGRSGQHEAVPFHADACGVSYKSGGLGGFEVGEVMRGVTGSIEHFENIGANRKSLSPVQYTQICNGDSKKLAE